MRLPSPKKVSTLHTILYIKVSKMTTILLKNSCEKQSSNLFLFRFRFFYKPLAKKMKCVKIKEQMFVDIMEHDFFGNLLERARRPIPLGMG